MDVLEHMWIIKAVLLIPYSVSTDKVQIHYKIANMKPADRFEEYKFPYKNIRVSV